MNEPITLSSPEGIVRAYTTMLLAATLAGAFARETSAQVTKPGNLPPSTGRLPAPARISAFQQPDGKIRVVWSPVKNAFEYALVRSVPPDGAAAVALPNPSDTVYVDSDVKPGSTYYYVVTAQDGEQVGGMKASAPPVKVESRVAADTVKPPAVTPGSVAELTAVNASFRDPIVSLSWLPKQQGVYFFVERSEVTGTGQSPWHSKTMTICCSTSDYSHQDLPNGTRLIYRVMVVDSATQTNRSAPMLSNEVVIHRLQVKPALVSLERNVAVYPRPTLLLNTDKHIQGLVNVRWLAQNESLVKIDTQGGVTGLAVGDTVIVAIGTTADGSVQVVVYPIKVIPGP
jgi:hypothetical protein